MFYSPVNPGRFISPTLDGPFLGLLHQDGADEAADGSLVGEDSDDFGAPLDLAVEALDWIRAVQFRPVLLGKGHVGEDVFLGSVHEGRELGQLRAHLVRDLAPLRLGRRVVGLGKGGGDEG